MLYLAAPLASTAAASPHGIEALDRNFVCPETLPDDEARMASVRDFVVRYGRIDPRAPIAQRLAARDRLLEKHRCRPETLTHTFPER